jgi:hypothetical protein
MRTYGKLHTAFWASKDIQVLSCDEKLLAAYLLTSQHTTITGAFRLPDGYVMADLQWPNDKVEASFKSLEENGFLVRDKISGWVFINKYLLWNEIENPNQAKAVRRLMEQMPEGNLKDRLRAAILTYVSHRGEDSSQTVTKQSPNQEQEKKQEQDSSPPSLRSGGEVAAAAASASKAVPPCPYDQIVAKYHERLPALPQVKTLTDKRRAAIRARWTWAWERNRDRKSWRSVNDGIAYFDAFFGYVADSSPFLLGQGKPRADGERPFKADLEWLMTEGNFVKTIEGKYADTNPDAEAGKGGEGATS